MRPRWLYFWLFAWFASQGRFTSLFLEDLGLSETNIGILLSMRSVISVLITPPVALYADKLVANGTSYGYELIVAILSILSTISFLLHGLSQLPGSPFHNIYYIFFVRNLYSALVSPIYSIIDGITLKYLTDHGEGKEGYGKERLYGAVSWAIVSFFLGGAIDYFTSKIMYLFITITLIPLLICIWVIGNEHNSSKGGDDSSNLEMVENSLANESASSLSLPSEDEISLLAETEDAGSENDFVPTATPSVTPQPLSYFRQLMVILSLFFSSIHGVLFIILFLVLRMGTSIVENLVFLFFTKDLNSSNFICGLSVVITVLFEIPIFHYSSYFLASLHQQGLMIVACLSYSTRVVGYTMLTSPWYILCLEPLHGVTYGFSTIASVDYVAGMVPNDLQATGQGLLGSLQTGIGSLIGVGLGGYIEEKYGSVVLYRGAGVVVGGILCFYLLGVWVERSRKVVNSERVS